ncbi:regulatory-associated protein of mTOR [Pectinophora gossypiella]|nr:regulatory-associated protein of mTOR [Pectinophora gossypiella]
MTEMPPYLTVKDEEKNSGQTDSDSSDIDDWDMPLCFDKPRHTEPIKGAERVEHSWRVKEKYKTHCVALVLCLNVGVDPPDVVKTQPCARLECWIDPNSLSPSKALESIGHALQAQYERWQPRARYKQSLDPTSDEVKKLCCSLRRNAKDERVLFHYNGHGVPKPTAQGEIWVFNRAYTQYIPLSMYDLQTWMGAPSLYVYDCSSAGIIVENFKTFAEQHEREQLQAGAPTAGPPVSYRNCIQLAACAAGQALPMHPELPADLFTACLTTPVKMAMKWFVLRHRTRGARPDLHDLIDKIPGQVTDRRTMLGELNWIFTAITDTIAWSSLPAELFHQLFRADLLTASLCRNFLLADRIMRSYNCTPVSAPALPSLATHPLWAAWEHTLDLALAQLPQLLQPRPPDYRHSPFFRDQLTAFQVWLDLGKWSPLRAPPQQLPMVLQVLLSTLHRVRALQILCRFLALGAWAVRAVLHVGIFPYMLKLLQASAPDLRPTMVYIWAKIIAVDPSCQVDLVNAKGHKYFLSVLQDPAVDSTHRTLAAYVLAGIVDGYAAGQEAALQGSMISACLEQLGEPAPALRQWACIALGRLWRAYDAARWAGVRDLAHEKLYPLLLQPQPEVRAACAFALGTFVAAGGAGPRTDHACALEQQVGVALAARAPRDASPLVRAEILAALQWLVLIFEQHFIAVYIQERMRRSDRQGAGGGGVDPGQDALEPRGPARAAAPATQPLALPAIGFGSVYMKLWHALAAMAREPHPQVAQMAGDIIAHVANQVDNVSREVEQAALAGSPGGGRGGSLPPSPNTRPGAPASAPAVPRRLRTLTADDEPGAHDRDSASSTSGEYQRPGPGSTGDYILDVASEPQGDRIIYISPAVQVGSRCCSFRRTRLSCFKESIFLWHVSCPPISVRGARGARKTPPQQSVSAGPASKKAIVSTSFVAWCAAAAARPEPAPAPDVEARPEHEARWRAARNRRLRDHAARLRGTRVARLETQGFHSRCPLPPAVVLFHPYDQHLAVASKDNFGIWDWGTAAKLCVGSWRRAWGRITALAYLNAHQHALLAVASHAGQLALYRPLGSSLEPALVSAWRALPVRAAADYRPPPAQPLYSLAQLVSEQFAGGDERPAAGPDPDLAGGAGAGAGYAAGPPGVLLRWAGARCSLALAGPAAVLRLWDAAAELLAADVSTDTDAAATALWRGGAAPAGPDAWLCAAGFADGAVRAWDERAAGAGPVLALHEHAAPVLSCARRSDVHVMLTACAAGQLRLYDTRKLAPASPLRAPGPLAAVDVHPLADLLACGSVNQCIGIYDLKGSSLNTIRFHEGFMGARIGPVSCLAFHPLRCALGVGSKDSTVSVYVSEARR